jgi:hypothetical protein
MIILDFRYAIPEFKLLVLLRLYPEQEELFLHFTPSYTRCRHDVYTSVLFQPSVVNPTTLLLPLSIKPLKSKGIDTYVLLEYHSAILPDE